MTDSAKPGSLGINCPRPTLTTTDLERIAPGSEPGFHG